MCFGIIKDNISSCLIFLFFSSTRNQTQDLVFSRQVFVPVLYPCLSCLISLWLLHLHEVEISPSLLAQGSTVAPEGFLRSKISGWNTRLVFLCQAAQFLPSFSTDTGSCVPSERSTFQLSCEVSQVQLLPVNYTLMAHYQLIYTKKSNSSIIIATLVVCWVELLNLQFLLMGGGKRLM